MNRQRGTGRRVRKGIRRIASRSRPGEEWVPIDDLVSPLRYDVIVRQRFFERIGRMSGADRADTAALAERERSGPYHAWFAQVAVPLFRSQLVGDEDAIEEAFEQRVADAVGLYESFDALRADEHDPLTLTAGRVLARTPTGKRLERRLYVGDGCHRLALLRLRGARALTPGSYRVVVQPRLVPIDNTARLIPLLGIQPAEYFRFLSLSYAPGAGCATRDQLLYAARTRMPERVDELERILAVDLPLLDT